MKKIIFYIATFLCVHSVNASGEYIYGVNGGSIYVSDYNNVSNGTMLLNVSTYDAIYSPDGQYIIYNDSSNNGKIYRKNANDSNAGSAITTSSVAGAQGISYSPDGQYIVYYNSSAYYGDIYRKNANDTSDGSAITSGALANISPSYSPDGQYIIYRTHPGVGCYIYRKNANDTSNGSAITSVCGVRPTYSPDGQYIIYINSSDNKLYRKNANDTSDGSAITSSNVVYATYTPDGQYILYVNSSDSSKVYKKNANDSSDGSAITSAGGIGYISAKPTLVPQPEPIDEFINGLNCTTDYIASTSGATWYNFSSLDNYVVAQTGSTYLYYGESSTDPSDYDVFYVSPYGSGTSFNSGSLKYPGTQTGYIRDTTNDFAVTTLQSARDGYPLDYNIVQFFGVENIAFGKAGVFLGSTVGDGGIINETPLSASGGATTFALKNYSGSIYTSILKYMYRFNGIRLGKGPLEAKKACGVGYNQCEWSYEGASLVCQGIDSASGVPFTGCGITGSGSVYGSGACVPLTDASGSLIPPPPVLGGYATYDGSGNIVGTVTPTVSSQQTSNGIFSCSYSENPSWYQYLGERFACVFITIPKNFFNKIWDGAAGTQDRIAQLGNTAQTLTGVQQSSGATTYTGSNTLLQKMHDIDEGISDNKKVNLFYALFLFGAFMIFLAVTIGILKK